MIKKISKMGVNFLTNEKVVSNNPGKFIDPREEEDDDFPEFPEEMDLDENKIILNEIKIIKIKLRNLEDEVEEFRKEVEGGPHG